MANCPTCNAPVKDGANYCVVCGAEQKRSRKFRTRSRVRELTFAALVGAALSAVLIASFRARPAAEAAHRQRATAVQNEPDTAPSTYIARPAEDDGDAVEAAPLPEPAKASPPLVPEPVHKKAPTHVTAPHPAATTPPARHSATTPPPSAESPSAERAPDAAPVSNADNVTPEAPDAATSASITPQPERPSSDSVASGPTVAQSTDAAVAQQGSTSSRTEASVRVERTLDEIYEQRTARCGGGVIGLLCRGTVRLNVCNGHWTQTETPGQIACYVGR
jgi:hypothetical protein